MYAVITMNRYNNDNTSIKTFKSLDLAKDFLCDWYRAELRRADTVQWEFTKISNDHTWAYIDELYNFLECRICPVTL